MQGKNYPHATNGEVVAVLVLVFRHISLGGVIHDIRHDTAGGVVVQRTRVINPVVGWDK